MTGRAAPPPPTPLYFRRVRVSSGGPLVDVTIRDGRVGNISLSTTAGRWAAPKADEVDGKGWLLLPGLEDAHVHITQESVRQRSLDLRGIRSAREAAELVAQVALDNTPAPGLPHQPSLVGHGFRDGLWPDEPTPELLDDAAGARPVILQSNDLHTAWLNSSALQLAGHPDGTGLLREQACYAAVALLAVPSQAQADAAALTVLTAAARRGVTSVIDFEYSDTLNDWKRRGATAQIDTRVTCVIARHLREETTARGLRTGDAVAGGHEEVTVGPLKFFLDGSLNSRTALCHDSYPDMTGPSAKGRREVDPETLVEEVALGLKHGLLPALHAIGDMAVSTALDVFERLGCKGRIEHAQLIRDIDLPRFSRSGLIVGIQPSHAPDDRDIADRHWSARTHRAYAYRALADAGATLRIGSDAPNAPLDPWDGIASAVLRTDDERPAWHPEQYLRITEALTAACGGRARIHVGDNADLVLLAHDPWTVAPSELRHLPVSGTLLGGRWTHRDFG